MTGRKRTMIERIDDLPAGQGNPPPTADQASVEIIGDSPAPASGQNVSQNVSTAAAAGNSQNVVQAAPDDCLTYRPANRPPMGILIIRDDGSPEGERVRLREERTVIGREGCDVVVGHDSAISTRHTEIVRIFENGRYRWFIRDLGSTNGTFVRIYRTNLKHNQEWMIGSNRYRYRMAHSPGTETVSDDAGGKGKRHNSTAGWQAVTSEVIQQSQPAFVTMLPTGDDGDTLPFASENLVLGSDPAKCSLVVKGDPFLSGIHASITRTSNGPWMIKDHRSKNGLWLRVSSLPIERKCEFQLGEQRFTFRVV